MLRITGADALDEDHLLWLLAVALDLACRGAGSRHQALELQPGHDLGILAVAEFGHLRGVEGIEASGHDDGIHLHVEELVFLVVVDGLRLAEILTGPAAPQCEVQAMLTVNDRYLGHGLGKGDVDVASPGETYVELQQQWPQFLVGDLFQLDRPCGADEGAGPAGNAVVGELEEGRPDFSVYAAPHETDGALADQFLAHPHAKSAQIAKLILRLEAYLSDPQAGSEFLHLGHVGTAGQEQLSQQLSPLQHLLRGRLHLDLPADGVVAGRDQPRAAIVGDLHRA